MTYREFCTQIVPMVNELQEECRKMEPEEFRKFRQELMEASAVRPEICRDFMEAVLDLIQKNIFQKNTGNTVCYILAAVCSNAAAGTCVLCIYQWTGRVYGYESGGIFYQS